MAVETRSGNRSGNRSGGVKVGSLEADVAELVLW